MLKHNSFDIPIGKKGEVRLIISGEEETCLILEQSDMLTGSGSLYQILEGHEYDYEVEPASLKLKVNPIVSPSKSERKKNTGRLRPNTFVGTIKLEIVDGTDNDVGCCIVEVISTKVGSQQHYQKMLSDIASVSLNLILQHSSPAVQQLQHTYKPDYKVDYQQFAFLNAILRSEEFDSAIHRIIAFPSTKWKEEECLVDTRRTRKVDFKIMRRFAGNTDRVDVSGISGLSVPITSLPRRIEQSKKYDNIDTPENQFIKHALSYFVDFVGKVKIQAEGSKLEAEASGLENFLAQILQHNFFREISSLNLIPLNSPVLQRKEGYRDVLKIWLQFDLAAKLAWEAQEAEYEAGKKNIAVLYEYWVFFKLLDLCSSLFQLDKYTVDNLIKRTKDNLGINLAQGSAFSLTGKYIADNRKLSICLSYNKTFAESKSHNQESSWTKAMRPDYTLSFWPADMKAELAEQLALITHIHFDAKYKISDPSDLFSPPTDDENNDPLKLEKQQNYSGNYKRADFLKMHAYRDAIRRSGGAYVLYPGAQDGHMPFQGFHEILPGIGAFSLNPALPEGGISEISAFLKKVILNLQNRTSHWEQSRLAEFTIHNTPPKEYREPNFPELSETNRNGIPSEINVLIGYIRSDEQEEWIRNTRKFNARAGNQRGGIRINSQEASAAYLLLYRNKKQTEFELYPLSKKGPEILSKQAIIKAGYTNARHDYYLVFDIMNEPIIQVRNCDLGKLIGDRIHGAPFCVKLDELTTN